MFFVESGNLPLNRSDSSGGLSFDELKTGKQKHLQGMKVLRAIGIIAAVFAAGILLLIGCFAYETRLKITGIDSSFSPDGTYEVLYQNIGEPDWPFGYSHARLVLKHGNHPVSEYRFNVANDGGVLHSDSWSVKWKDDAAEVTISGEEQSDVLYTLWFDGRTSSVLLDTPFGEWKHNIAGERNAEESEE